ncbi:MAG: hypothetical protein ACYDG2_06640 [Ruminiclostridium sp.]
MKKFIIVTVFVFLIAILLSFNYLLWDREKQLESFQDISDSNNLTIDTLSDKMNTLDKLNKELSKKVENLTEDNTAIKDNYSIQSKDNIDLKSEIISKNNLIIALKNTIDVVPMDTVIKKWTESVNSKNYEGAHALISKNSKDQTIKDAVRFKEVYQSELAAIKIKTSKLFTELTDDEHLGKIQFKVVFEVQKPDVTDKNKDKIPQDIFKSGDNDKYITMELDSDTKGWVILEIEDEP